MSAQPNTPYGVRTLDELVQFTYGRTPEDFIKAGGGIGTDTTGVYNPIYGAMIWANFNLEANLFGCLSKYIWDYSGWRIFTEKADNMYAGLTTGLSAAIMNNTALGGTLEGGQIAQPLRPIVKEISVRPKTIQYGFEASEVQEHLTNNSRDDLWGSLAHQKVYGVNQMKENLNKQLFFNIRGKVRIGAGDTDADFAENNNTRDLLERRNIESIDRIVSSSGEAAQYGKSGDSRDKLYNPWINVDRDGAQIVSKPVSGDGLGRTGATHNAYDTTVISPGSSISDPDNLTPATMRSFLADVRPKGGKDPTLFLGGHDTYNELQGIYEPALRIMNPSDLKTAVSVGVNGINTFQGTGIGLHISTIYDIPIIPSKDTPSNSPSANDAHVGNLYAIDASDPEGSGKPRIGISVLKPLVYYEASHRTQTYPFINSAFVDKGVFECIMEFTCQQFQTQGKIINIRKSASLIMVLYQNKTVSKTQVVRPKYGVIRSVYVSGASNKEFCLYSAKTVEDCVDPTDDVKGNRILKISYPNSASSRPDLHIAFSALTVKVNTEDGNTDDGSEMQIIID